MVTNCVFSVAPSLGAHGARTTEIRGSNPLCSARKSAEPRVGAVFLGSFELLMG